MMKPREQDSGDPPGSSDSTARFVCSQGKENRCCSKREASSHGAWYTLRPVFVAVFAVLVALILSLMVAIAVLDAGRCEECLAPVLGCPSEWVGYRNVCYFLSRDEGNWDWSRERCSSLGASLAVLEEEWELEFLSRLKGKMDYWLGLQKRGERLEWVDGRIFNQTFPVSGDGPCFFLNNGDLWSSSRSQVRPYLCSKGLPAKGTT